MLVKGVAVKGPGESIQEITFAMVFEGTNTEEQESFCSFLLQTNGFIKRGMK